jgi:hypothetical protein
MKKDLQEGTGVKNGNEQKSNSNIFNDTKMSLSGRWRDWEVNQKICHIKE